MKNLLLPFVAASLLVALPGQDAATKALQRAQLLEQQEGDLAAAQQAYRALLADAAASAVHGEAALRLGTVLWRLEQRDTATPLLQQAVATGGDVAARANAVLQGQDAESKQQAELLAKAEALAKRIVELALSSLLSGADRLRLDRVVVELRSLGPIAARAAVQEIERQRPLGVTITANGRTDSAIDVLLSLVWQVGGPHAIDALSRWSQDPDVHWRRRVAQALETTSPFAADLMPTLKTYLADRDPAGEVGRSLEGAVAQLPHEEHVRLAQSTTPALQRAGLVAMATRWFRVPSAVQKATVDELAPTLVRATHAQDPMLARAAWDLLFAFAYRGPANGQMLLCSQIERMPSFEPPMQASHNREGQDDAWLAAIAQAAVRLGALSERREGDGRTLLAQMLTGHQPAWTSKGVAAALQLIELGYAGGIGIPMEADANQPWLLHLVQLADAGQTVRLIAALGRMDQTERLMQELQQRPVPADAFTAVRELLDPRGGAPRPAWADLKGTTTRWVRGGQRTVSTPSSMMLRWLQLAADSGHPEAAAWLWSQLEGDATLAEPVASCLRTLSWNGDKAAAVELRKVLVWPGTDQNELQPFERSLVLAELVRIGDVPTIELLPRAYELGLETVITYYGTRGRTVSPPLRVEAAGIGFLMKTAPESLPTAPVWHGYDELHLQRAWRTALSSPASAETAWMELAARQQEVPGTATTGQGVPGPRRASAGGIRPTNQRGIPVSVGPLLLELLAPWWAAQREDDSKQAAEVMTLLGRSMSQWPDEAFAPTTPLHTALQQALRSDDRTFAEALLWMAGAKVRAQFPDEARAIVKTTENRWMLESLVREGLELPDTTWLQWLQHRDPQLRKAALGLLPAVHAGSLRDAITARLHDDQGEVRMAACGTMARLFGTAAVPALLPLLQDQEENVRKIAREQLEKLRQDAEQRTFWQKAQAGIDTSSQGAATKLLLQAKAGEPKEQRLLALRSLAVLGVAETLPYLIDAANDADAEIAAAARAAITAIHQKGGLPAERPAAEPARSK